MDSVSNDVLQSLGIAREAQQSQQGNNNELGADEYLNLMIAQIRNQDPFEPMTNGDFIGQLAQFGTVSGIDALQQSFASFSGSLSSGQGLQAASLVGHTVQVRGDSVSLNAGESVSGSVDVAESSSAVQLTITDDQGNFVNSIELGPQQAGVVDFVWDGTDANGSRLPPGQYQVAAQMVVGNESVAAGTLVNQRVDSVTLGGANQRIELNLADGQTVFLDEVRQVR